MTNQVIETIKSRRSIRAYKPQPLSQEQIDILIEAALAAPSAKNMQPWSINVLQNKAVIDEWEKAVVNYFVQREDKVMLDILTSRKFRIFYDAPCVFVIPINLQSIYAAIDAGILVQNIALAAKSIGLDSVILGIPHVIFTSEKADEWKKKLSFPEGFVYGISIAVGYADMEKQPHVLEPSKVVYIP